MIKLRLDPRLQGRVDPSDVLQEAFLEASERLDEYVQNHSIPFYLWIRRIAGQKLYDLHRYHLKALKRSALKEKSLYSYPIQESTTLALAKQFVAQGTTPSNAAIRRELIKGVLQALDDMDPLDREILALRHFEMLSNTEAARELGINATAAGKRYIRALKKLKGILTGLAG